MYMRVLLHVFAHITLTLCADTMESATVKDAVIADTACSFDKDLACKEENAYLLQQNAHLNKARVGVHESLASMAGAKASTGSGYQKARTTVRARRARRTRRKHAWDCAPYPVNFNLTDIVTNNLGFQGPSLGPLPEIRYSSAAKTKDGQVVDFVLKATTPYLTGDPSANGIKGVLGAVNVKAGTCATLALSFMKTGNAVQQVNMEDFDLSFFDVDKGGPANVPPHDSQDLVESITIGGFHEYHLNSQSTIEVYKLPSGQIKFDGSQVGREDEFTRYPNILSAAEASKAVNMKFYNVSRVDFTLCVSPGHGGRTFLFGGKSALVQCTAVPLGWGRPSCGVVPNRVPLNQVGYSTVLQGHPLCLEEDMAAFIRRVIANENMCIRNPAGFKTFVKFFNGVCSMKKAPSKLVTGSAPLNFKDLIMRLNQDVRRPSACGGGWIVFAGPDGRCQFRPAMVQVAEPAEGSGMIGKTAPLSEYGYRMVALTNSRTDMKSFIQRISSRLELRITRESSLEGFIPHYLARCGIQSFENLVYELQLKGYALPCNCGDDWIEWNEARR